MLSCSWCPQGLVLGSIYHDARRDMSENVFFADDTLVISYCRDTDLAVTKSWMDCCHGFGNGKFLLINENKTQAVVYCKLRTVHSSRIQINEHRIRWDDEASYLGLIIDKSEPATAIQANLKGSFLTSSCFDLCFSHMGICSSCSAQQISNDPK